jgi:hypothetical protein
VSLSVCSYISSFPFYIVRNTHRISCCFLSLPDAYISAGSPARPRIRTRRNQKEKEMLWLPDHYLNTNSSHADGASAALR